MNEMKSTLGKSNKGLTELIELHRHVIAEFYTSVKRGKVLYVSVSATVT